MNNHGASGAAIAGILIVVVILIVVLYGFNSGALNLGKSPSSKLPSTFSISAAANSSQLYSGKSSPLYVTLFNPFNQSLNANLVVLTAPPVSVSPSSKSITVPANMQTQSTILFNASCTSSTGSVIPYFALEVQNFWQNLTTSVVTYPYGTKSSLIPQSISSNTNQGFMTLSAPTTVVETQIPGGSLAATITFDASPNYNSGNYKSGSPYTSISNNNPNGYISTINLYISNSTGGIASALVYYNGQNYPFSVSGKTLSLTLHDVNLALITSGSGLPLEITVTNDNASSQNIVTIDTNYNYYIAFNSNQISCI
ncbi:hypothetical protein M1494_00255 [Candidatus Parvarchaeota archaeon]|nr:hypothetical protein [Candidatus Parvarchaeota archaeon]